MRRALRHAFRRFSIDGLTGGLAAAAVAASVLAAGGAPAQAQNQDVAPFGLDRLFRPPGSVGGSGSGEPAGDGPTTDQVLRIERLESQIRQMTGTIEQLQYRNQQLENQIRSMGGTAAGGAAAGPGAPPPQAYPQQPPYPAPDQRPAYQPPAAASGGAPGRRSDVFDPSQAPNAPGAPRTLGSMQQEPPPIAGAPIGAPGGRSQGAPLDLSSMPSGAGPAGAAGSVPQGHALPPPPQRRLSATGGATAPPSQSPKDVYDLGYGYMLRKDYALAEDTFRDFLARYPRDPKAPEAQFWIGESLYQRQRYDVAAQAFLDLTTKHAGHPKAPEALLRLGQSLAELKQKDMSCATLAEVGRKYPKAPANVKQGVARELKRVRC